MAHPTLQNEDILREIVKHLSPPMDHKIVSFSKFDAPHRATLLNVALSCKVFRDPALDVLWMNVDDILNLFRVLPAFYRLNRTYVLDGPISENDWSRFDFYAQRIRHLVYFDPEIDSSVYSRMTWLRQSTPILPSLISFCAVPFGPGLLSFLSPTLRTVGIFTASTNEHVPAVWTFMDALTDSEKYPYLENLNVQALLTPPSLLSLSRIPNLRDLTLFGVGVNDLGLFAALSELQKLASLSIEFRGSSSFVTRHKVQPATAFPALETLSLSIETRHVPPLLKFLPHDKLKKFGIIAAAGTSGTRQEKLNWLKIFETIGSRFSGSMKSLDFTVDHSLMSQTAIEASDCDFQMFQPLRDMPELEEVLFHLFPWMSFSDEGYKALAAVWPKAQKLAFPPSPTPIATFISLQYFALTCPALRYLCLSFDACNLPPIASDNLPLSSHTLEQLDVLSSPVADERSAARHIDRLFPSLKQLSFTPVQNNEKWQQVTALLPILSAVRGDQSARHGLATQPSKRLCRPFPFHFRISY
ncbi:hypothetical protein Hypma_002865 [Hypsizygus marmoreus]|uniref:F-box domain-containing protein n=1 Tax=Hypsizygus marmoreus TaxID=39966 RepID=A0A369JCL3_HYPMA|nr:hypothetical protein Hypma_002865 [Hypsizygus marmoreus]